MTESARILMYSQDSFGLGHLRRLTNVANELVRQRRDVSVLLLVDSPVAPFFELRPHIDFVKLPTVVKLEAGVFSPGRLLTDYDVVREMRSDLIVETVRRFRPHLFLVDHMPGGANCELLPALEMIRSSGMPTKMVLGLRDIIDHPDVTCAVWQRERVYETMLQFYDWVLVYGSAEIFPTAEKYRLPATIRERIQYGGYVCNMDPVKDPQRVRARLGVRDERLVVVTAGGGLDAYQLMKTYVRAVERLNGCVSFATVMITGPFMPEAKRRKLRDRAKELGIQIHSSVGDSISKLNAADLVVSMAGYNTLSEILRFGKRAIVVPRAGPSAEQMMRARIFAERGLIRMVEPEQLSVRRLAKVVQDELTNDGPRQPNGTPRLHGVATVTDTLLGFLDPSRPELAPTMAVPAHRA